MAPLEEGWFERPLASLHPIACRFQQSWNIPVRSRSSLLPIDVSAKENEAILYKSSSGFEPTTFLIQASVRYEAHTNPQDHGALAYFYLLLLLQICEWTLPLKRKQHFNWNQNFEQNIFFSGQINSWKSNFSDSIFVTLTFCGLITKLDQSGIGKFKCLPKIISALNRLWQCWFVNILFLSVAAPFWVILGSLTREEIWLSMCCVFRRVLTQSKF